MHELSIAVGIVDLAESKAKNAGAGKILNIELEIGKLSGVEPDALEFAWPVAVKGTMLEDAKKTIVQIAGRAKCTTCGLVFEVENLYDSCPGCSGIMKDIIQGKELRIKTITVDD
jgi:hydrogenase nickel incorporation protein HypA/HybF